VLAPPFGEVVKTHVLDYKVSDRIEFTEFFNDLKPKIDLGFLIRG
jgi:hypothetical protein